MDTREIIPTDVLEEINSLDEVSGWESFNAVLSSVKADMTQAGSYFQNPQTQVSGWQNLIRGIKDMVKMQVVTAKEINNYDPKKLIDNLTSLTATAKPHHKSLGHTISDSKAYISIPVFRNKKHEFKIWLDKLMNMMSLTYGSEVRRKADRIFSKCDITRSETAGGEIDHMISEIADDLASHHDLDRIN